MYQFNKPINHENVNSGKDVLFLQVMQKSCRFSFMYGELTDKNTISALNDALETHQQDQYEILLYRKNRKLTL